MANNTTRGRCVWNLETRSSHLILNFEFRGKPSLVTVIYMDPHSPNNLLITCDKMLFSCPLVLSIFFVFMLCYVIINICKIVLLPTSHPREDARMARRQQNRAAQDWAIGRKILDRAEKSVTWCNIDSHETKWSVVNQSKGSAWRTGSSWIKHKNFTQFPPSRLPVFIYLNFFVKLGHCSQETWALDIFY